VIDGNRAVFVVDKDRGDAGAVYIVGRGLAVAGGEDVEVVVVLDRQVLYPAVVVSGGRASVRRRRSAVVRLEGLALPQVVGLGPLPGGKDDTAAEVGETPGTVEPVEKVKAIHVTGHRVEAPR
jgi:hypothetical protein